MMGKKGKTEKKMKTKRKGNGKKNKVKAICAVDDIMK